MNTAEHRTKAWDLEEAGDLVGAAFHYEQALEKYPPHHPGNQLARTDKDGLQRRAAACRSRAVALGQVTPLGDTDVATPTRQQPDREALLAGQRFAGGMGID